MPSPNNDQKSKAVHKHIGRSESKIGFAAAVYCFVCEISIIEFLGMINMSFV